MREQYSLSRIGIPTGPHTVESRVKQSQIMDGKLFKDQFGNVYETTGIAADKLGLDRSAIHAVLRGKHHHTKGFVFTYIDEVLK